MPNKFLCILYCSVLLQFCDSLQFSDQTVLMTIVHLMFFMLVEHLDTSLSVFICNVCINLSKTVIKVASVGVYLPWKELLL